MITDIHLQQYRSYSDDSFELSPSVNIIVGPNASGKTNLLEAILVIASSKSYRASDFELIKTGASTAKVETHTPDGFRSVKLAIDPTTTKLFEINGQKLKRLSLARTIPYVLFEPNQLVSLIGSPEARRTYIDDLLERTEVGFGLLRRQYYRTLAQRNTQLKNATHGVKSQLFVWNVRLSLLGGQLAAYRLSIIEHINAKLPKVYDHIAHTNAHVSLQYSTGINLKQYESDLLKQLEISEEVDYQRGYTTRGPHRDDIGFLLHDRRIQEIGSRGEVRSLLLATKVVEAHLINKARGTPPILLLDDVFSELDDARRFALTEYLQKYQTFITTTDADVVIQHFTQKAHIIPLGQAGN